MHVVQDPCSVRRDPAVDGRCSGSAAGFCAEGNDADKIVFRRSVQAVHLHQGSAAVTTAGIFTRNTTHAHLLVLRNVCESPESYHTPFHFDDRQFDRLQNRTRLRVIYQ